MRSPKSLLLFLLFFASLSFGTITRDGSCSVTGTSCTFSATATGSLKIVFAFRTTSTAPSVPAGWTTIKLSVTGGTTSFAMGCNVSSSSADTGTGTWTNATSVVGISYSGTAVTTTAQCTFTGLGLQTDSAATSTTASYAALTMVSSRADDWVIGFLGGSASSECVPTGMSSISTTGTILASDTNAGVASWGTTTCTVSSENWHSSTIEVRASAVWTIVQTASCSALTATSACAITVSSTGAGHVMLVTAGYGNTSATISSVTGGGSNWVHPAGCQSPDATQVYATDAIYTLNSASGSTTITVNLSANSTGAWGAQVAEFSFTGSVAFDACGTVDTAAGNPQPGATLTLGGTTDVIAQVGQVSSGTFSSVASPYGPLVGTVNVNQTKSAWVMNTSSGAASSWTLGNPIRLVGSGIALKAVASCALSTALTGVGCR